MTNRTPISARLLGPVLAGFFIMGFCDLVAPITGRIAADFPPEAQAAVSFLPTMVFLWFLVLSTPVASLMNRWGRRTTALVGYGFTFAGMMVPYVAGAGCALVWYFVGFGLLGIGNTFVQVAVNPLLATIVPGDRMTSFLTVGQIFRNTSLLLLAPLVTMLVAWTGSWRLLLPIYGVLTLVGGVWLQLAAIPEPARKEHTAGLSECFRLLKNRRVLLSTLGVACFIAGDVAVGYLSVRLIDNPSSILTTTGFYACRIVGTLLGAWLLVRVSDTKYLAWNMAGGLALALALVDVLCRGDESRAGEGQRSGRTDDPGHLGRSRFGTGLRRGDPSDGESSPGNAFCGGVPGLHALGGTPSEP